MSRREKLLRGALRRAQKRNDRLEIAYVKARLEIELGIVV